MVRFSERIKRKWTENKMRRRFLGLILIVAVCACLGTGVAVTSSASAYDTTISDWGLNYFNSLNYGIYWYTDPNEKVPTKEYKIDPTKPTIIYTHGWKPNESHLREGLSLKDGSVSALKNKGFEAYPYDDEFYRYYLKNGYNVGVFYWNQLIDEALDFGVDEKIWVSNGHYKMRYKKYSSVSDERGVLSDEDDPANPKKSVALLYADAIIEALGNDYEQNLHLVGHSMGGQLSCAVTEALCVKSDKGEIPSTLLPERVTLLDPYFSATALIGTEDHTGKSAEGKIITELVADAMDTIRAHGIPIEAYGANLGMVFRNYGSLAMSRTKEEIAALTERIGKNCVWVYMESIGLFGGFSPTHVMAVDYYFTTNNFQPRKSVEGVIVPSAQVPTEVIQSEIGLTFKQSISSGENPLYYTAGKFELVDFETMDAPDIITGKTKSVRRTVVVKARLVDADNKIIATQDVDEFSSYRFENIPVGDYKVIVSYNGKDDPAVDVSVKPFGHVNGKLNLTKKSNAPVYAYLVDENNEKIAETTVDNGGYYYFSGVKDGEYTLKIVSSGKTALEVGEVKVAKDTLIPTAVETKDVTIESNMETYILYGIICLCAILVIVVIVVLVTSLRRRKKRING